MKLKFFHREELILFNPETSPAVKALQIRKLVASGIAEQYFGNLVSFESWSDVWIFKGLIKFFEYELNNEGEDAFTSNELFISEVLHPTLRRKSIESEIPISADFAISKNVAARGKTCHQT